jgi:hypothetical protein
MEKKKMKIKLKFVKRGFFKDIIWGLVACLFGIMATSLVVEVSHYYAEWFFVLFSFIFGLVIMFRFEENWHNLWSNNKKRKKKKKYLKVEDLEYQYGK